MDNVPVEMDKITDEVKEKLRDFDEEEAYFLLCEIFAYAQATQDYAKFQSDLAEWKKRYPIDLFSEKFKQKIKYMLSQEFLDKILKDYLTFDELSKKDPAKGLESLRKILNKAEKHKDAKQLDKDLETLYSEYPLEYLKEKYPHVVPLLVSKANREKILEKFDSDLAFKELNNIVENPQNYKNADEFKTAISEYQKQFPTVDFNDKYRSLAEKTLSEFSDERKLEELFPLSELDLSEGKVIQIDMSQNVSLITKEARKDFFKIVDKNINDINGLFDWICKYSRYINTFDTDTKNAIVSTLMIRYHKELPTSTNYRIPDMEAKGNDLLTKTEFNNMGKTKKDTVIQLLCMLYSGQELSNDDCFRLDIINKNNEKAKIIRTIYR